mmetsp:Transcript_42420/g.55946  ORF Transcript_42420/g.55946 Transcript_42420/m.55946 type:complete len:152 (-) Transcript_42420:453-908(-)|eukprot:CAMPEP_0170462606 /NCGR_PEP_ID=MMETSP0123-20130129/8053_1 /TAXON_ID=182087 /ORGANISM="Favella ehrenbergii, Strain Fehren 1" /LENGTH=151 /DNA_ID=CAMNT_0010727877 /DNA_START=633 /DNA_END=1088 /DNA_ORIENTATION=+
MDQIIDQMDKYKKDAGQEALKYTNKIAEEQAALQEIEAEKAKLMIGNEEKTEERLKNTSQEGIILMSIKSLYQKIAYKSEQNGQEVIFIWRSGIPQQRIDEQQAAAREEYKPEECERQLDTIKEYIEGFNNFMKLLNESIDQDQKPQQKSK